MDQGSDHCPVYAVLKNRIALDGQDIDARDKMNPPGIYVGGIRQRDYSSFLDLLPLSGKLIPEFSGRRNIRDMFKRNPVSLQSSSHARQDRRDVSETMRALDDSAGTHTSVDWTPEDKVASEMPPMPSRKRVIHETTGSSSSKRKRPTATTATAPSFSKGQQTLRGFFNSIARSDPTRDHVQCVNSQPTKTDSEIHQGHGSWDTPQERPVGADQDPQPYIDPDSPAKPGEPDLDGDRELLDSVSAISKPTAVVKESAHIPIESKESWSRLFTKPLAPNCEGHDEPCISLLTKKAGMNYGRSFWMCPRPLGPSGAKEKYTQWRCQTFIWCSDWNPKGPSVC